MLRAYFFKLLRSSYLYVGMALVLGLCVFYANDYLGGEHGLGGADVFTCHRP